MKFVFDRRSDRPAGRPAGARRTSRWRSGRRPRSARRPRARRPSRAPTARRSRTRRGRARSPRRRRSRRRPTPRPTLCTVSGPTPRRRAPGRTPRAQRSAQLVEAARPRPIARRQPIARPLASANEPAGSKPERLADQRVVAELGVGVERQVVRGQRHVRAEQRLQPDALGRASTGWGREPQMIPWWQSTICAPARAACSKQLAVGRHAGDHLVHLARARAPGARWGRSPRTPWRPADRRGRR